MFLVTVLAVIGIVVYVVGQQVVGSALQGKRLVVLPAVLTVIEIADLSAPRISPGRDRYRAAGRERGDSHRDRDRPRRDDAP